MVCLPIFLVLEFKLKWFARIACLGRVGRLCDERQRQEYCSGGVLVIVGRVGGLYIGVSDHIY